MAAQKYKPLPPLPPPKKKKTRPLTTTQIVRKLAQETGLPKQMVRDVLVAQSVLVASELQGGRSFMIPGIIKVELDALMRG
jgi:hypothetical protein